MFESIAYAQNAAPKGSSWGAFLPLIIIFVISIFADYATTETQ